MTPTKLQLATIGHIEYAGRIQRRIAMEAGFLSNFTNTIRDVVPSMMASIGSALKSVSFLNNEKQDTNGRSSFIALLDTKNFVKNSDINLIVPEGFSGQLTEYSELLKECSEHASNVLSGILIPYNTFLSQLLSSKSIHVSSVGKLSYLQKIDSNREDLSKKLGNFFVKGSTQVKQPMGKVLSRNKDWEVLLDSQNKTLSAINTASRKAVETAVDECVELIESIKVAAAAGELDGLSSSMIKQLSETTLCVANEVAFYSITLYRVNDLDKCISVSIESVKKELT